MRAGGGAVRHAKAHDHRALLIADEEETSASEVVAVTRHHQDRLRAQAGDPPRILDAPLFTPSHWSAGVQGADLVTFVNSRRRFGRSDGRPEDRRAQETLDGWWEAIEPQVEVRRCYEAPAAIDEAITVTASESGGS